MTAPDLLGFGQSDKPAELAPYKIDALCRLLDGLLSELGVPGPVVVRPLPVDIGPLTVDMVWLTRRDSDPAHRWLREHVLGAGVFS